MKWTSIGNLPRLNAALSRDSEWEDKAIKGQLDSQRGTGGEYSTDHYYCPIYIQTRALVVHGNQANSYH